MFQYEIIPQQVFTITKFEGDLDIDSTELVENELLPKLQPYEQISFHFGHVQFVDSSGMGLLLTLIQSLKEQGKKVQITNVREEVMEVFDLLQIPAIVDEQTFIR